MDEKQKLEHDTRISEALKKQFETPNEKQTNSNKNIQMHERQENSIENSVNESQIVNQNIQNTESFNTNQNTFEEVKSQYEEVEVKKQVKEVRTDSYFDGKLIELIGWNILSKLITLITLSIGAPWGKCMLLRYEIEHTNLNGKRLKFVGTGGEYFVERFKWIFFTIITLGIYGWWVPIKKTKWILSKIHFEDEAYVKEESYFDGKVIQLVGINILSYLITSLSFGILFPFARCLKLKWIAKHSIINKKKIVFDGKALSLFGHYLLWMFLTIITFGIFGLWLGIKITKWEVKNSHIKLAGEVEKKDNNALIAIILSVIIIPIGLIVIVNLLIPIIGSSNFFEGFRLPFSPVKQELNGSNVMDQIQSIR